MRRPAGLLTIFFAAAFQSVSFSASSSEAVASHGQPIGFQLAIFAPSAQDELEAALALADRHHSSGASVTYLPALSGMALGEHVQHHLASVRLLLLAESEGFVSGRRGPSVQAMSIGRNGATDYVVAAHAPEPSDDQLDVTIRSREGLVGTGSKQPPLSREEKVALRSQEVVVFRLESGALAAVAAKPFEPGPAHFVGTAGAAAAEGSVPIRQQGAGAEIEWYVPVEPGQEESLF